MSDSTLTKEKRSIPNTGGRKETSFNLSPILAGLLLLIAIFDGSGVYRALTQSTDPIREIMFLHFGSILLGMILVIVLRGGFTFAIFSGLLGLVLPVVGTLATAVIVFSLRREVAVEEESQLWILGNPSRYRPAPDSPGEAIEAGGEGERGAALWLRHADSREAVRNLQALRDEEDPFTSLYASGALETQLGYLESRISRLRARVKSLPEDDRAQRHLAEALIYLVELQDPKTETGEGVKAIAEARRILDKLEIRDSKLKTIKSLKAAEEMVRQGNWRGVVAALPGDAPIPVRSFWTGDRPQV